MTKRTKFNLKYKRDQCSITSRMMNRIALFVLLFFMLVSAMPASAASQDATQKEGWQFGADLYGWMSGMGMKTNGGDNIQLDFDDLLRNLEFTFMGGVSARNGRWSFSTDILTMELKGDNSNSMNTSVGPIGHEITVDAKTTVRMQAWVVTPLVGYTFFDNGKLSAEAVAGARYLWIKSELDLEVDGPLQPRDKKLATSGDVWDGVVGIRGKVTLDEKWHIPYYADLGTGQSAFTWQAIGGIGYKIGKKVDVVAAYRYLYWNFKDNKILDQLDISGPLVGLKFHF